MRDRHKKMCVTPKKVNTKSIWSKAAQKAAGSHKLYNSPVKGYGGWYIDEGQADNLAILIQDIASLGNITLWLCLLFTLTQLFVSYKKINY